MSIEFLWNSSFSTPLKESAIDFVMLLRIRYLPLLTVFTLSSILSQGQGLISYKVSEDLLRYCAKGKKQCQPILIERYDLNDPVNLVFPGGGGLCSVHLYTIADIDRFMRSHIVPRPLRIGRARDEEPVLDLTYLADGRYGAEMFSLEGSAGMDLILRTLPSKN